MADIHISDIQVLLFGPGLPAAGQAAQCVIEQSALRIRMQQADLDLHRETVLFSELTARVAGFDHDQLQLGWHRQQDAWSIMPAGKREQKALVAALPPGSVAGLTQWKRSTQSQGLVWKGIFYSACLLCLAFALLIWQHDRLTGWAANRVSMKTEKRLGDSVLKSLNPQANFLNGGAAQKAVQAIGGQLTAGSRYQYQWYVAKDDTVNAFAIPGGIIVVNSGLLEKANSPNELAAVLAHEVQHVEQRHALKNMINSAGIAAVVLVVLGDANAVVMLMAHQVSAQYFNRQVESEADLKGAQLLQEKNIDAGGMVSFFKRLNAGFNALDKKPDGEGGAENETNASTVTANKGNVSKNAPSKNTPSKAPEDADADTSGVSAWFSSHPDTLTRIQSIEHYLAAHPCNTCKSLAWDKQAIAADLRKAVKRVD